MSHIKVVKDGAVAEIILNRPEKMNAMTPQMALDLEQACRELDKDNSVNVVILHGAGDRAFCAGSDLKALDEYEGTFDFRNRVEYATQIRELRKPCIVAVGGWAMGGGLEMALSADIRICSRSSKFGAPEVTLGWVGAGGASQLLPRLIGYGKSMHMLLSGEAIDAEQALAWGLVEELVEDGQEVQRARELAKKMAKHNTIATQTVKASVRQSMSTPLNAGLIYENEVMSLAFALGSDAKGRESFKERS